MRLGQILVTGVICVWEVASAVCSCHGHQVMTADTRTIEAHSDIRACATRAPLKPLAWLAFRWNLIFRASLRKLKALQVVSGARANTSSYTGCAAFYRFTLRAKCINIQIAALTEPSMWMCLSRLQEPLGGLLEVIQLGSCFNGAQLEVPSGEP